ncbi:MAG: DEAD/DEAH box helicase [Reyranella sp.]|uniref:DEAD/DEAH box helicase n=1 Tax=Reyranella sp. TaxID=1929291 RepID=UPI003D14FBE2
MTDVSFADLGLSEPLLRALSAAKYTQPTPIQARTIPALLQGRDVLGIAQTGTGKTAAFALPVLQHLAAQGGRAQPKSPRALVLAPTRELAVQIARSFDTYGRGLGLRLGMVIGGLGFGRQIETLNRGVDILVATPGRLLDLVERGNVRLGSVTFLVLDEADRMFDMGFIKDVRRIVGAVSKLRQTLMFSATMPPDIAGLAAEILHRPERVEIAPQGRTVDRIDQGVYFVNAATKRALLSHLLADSALERVIVFTRTKRGANRVAEALDGRGVPSEAIHGNKSQNARQRALDSFSRGRARVLVATDLAARGIDVQGVTHVINYELPADAESYVHRIGRTARAGASGIAISFCDNSERGQLKSIERLTNQRIAVLPTPANEDLPQQAAAAALRAPEEHRDDRPGEHRGPRRPRGQQPHRHGHRSDDNPRDGHPRDGHHGGHHAGQPHRPHGDHPRGGHAHGHHPHGHHAPGHTAHGHHPHRRHEERPVARDEFGHDFGDYRDRTPDGTRSDDRPNNNQQRRPHWKRRRVGGGGGHRGRAA